MAGTKVTRFDFDTRIDRKDTNSAKWEFMRKFSPHASEDTLPLWVADMDFACAPAITDAMKSRVEDLIFGYSMPDQDYYNSVCSWLSRRFEWQVDPADIVVTSGVIPALETLLSVFTQEGDGVIIQPPVYHMFAKVIKQKSRTVVNNPLIEEKGEYRIDFEDLERKARLDKNRIMFFCSPHNPTGNVWSEEDLRRIGEICLKHDVILVSDEIHFDLLRKDVRHLPVASLFPDNDKIITCTAPSKTFNLAGLHMSNIVIRNAEQKKLWSEKAGFFLPSPIGITAVKAAYNDSEEWLNQLNQYLDENFRFALSYIREAMPRARFIVPDGTYFIWLDLRAYDIPSTKLDELMIKKANVLLEGGTMFGEEGEGFQRINIACPRELLKEALNRIGKALSD